MEKVSPFLFSVYFAMMVDEKKGGMARAIPFLAAARK